MPRRRGVEKPPSSLYLEGQIGPCGGDAEPVGGVPGHQLFIITLWAVSSLTYLSLHLRKPCGFCLRDEGKQEEG